MLGEDIEKTRNPGWSLAFVKDGTVSFKGRAELGSRSALGCCEVCQAEEPRVGRCGGGKEDGPSKQPQIVSV